MRKLFSLRVAWLLILAAAISWAVASVRDWLILSYPQNQPWLFWLGNLFLMLVIGYFVIKPLAMHFGIPDTDRPTAIDHENDG